MASRSSQSHRIRRHHGGADIGNTHPNEDVDAAGALAVLAGVDAGVDAGAGAMSLPANDVTAASLPSQEDEEPWDPFVLEEQRRIEEEAELHQENQLASTLRASLNDRGGPSVPTHLRRLQETAVSMGNDIYDERVTIPASLKDPLSLNWLVNPCTLGNSPVPMNMATYSFLQAEATAQGRDYVVHPVTKERIPLTTIPVLNPVLNNVIGAQYSEALKRIVEQEKIERDAARAAARLSTPVAQGAATNRNHNRTTNRGNSQEAAAAASRRSTPVVLEVPTNRNRNGTTNRGNRQNTGRRRIGRRLHSADQHDQNVLLVILQEAKNDSSPGPPDANGNPTVVPQRPWARFKGQRGAWLREKVQPNRHANDQDFSGGLFCTEMRGPLSGYNPVKPSTLQTKIKNAIDHAMNQLADGSHSTDQTGAEGEAAVPVYWSILMEYLEYLESNRNQNTMSARRRTTLENDVIGAQRPLGSGTQSLRTTTTQPAPVDATISRSLTSNPEGTHISETGPTGGGGTGGIPRRSPAPAPPQVLGGGHGGDTEASTPLRTGGRGRRHNAGAAGNPSDRAGGSGGVGTSTAAENFRALTEVAAAGQAQLQTLTSTIAQSLLPQNRPSTSDSNTSNTSLNSNINRLVAVRQNLKRDREAGEPEMIIGLRKTAVQQLADHIATKHGIPRFDPFDDNDGGNDENAGIGP